MVKKMKSWFNLLFLTLVLITPGVIFAIGSSAVTEKASPINRLNNAAANNNGPYTEVANELTMAKTLGIVVNVALSILGIVFIFIVIISGYKWMSAQGNEQEITKAKDSMTRAIIGLVVVLSSFAIWTFIKTSFITKL